MSVSRKTITPAEAKEARLELIRRWGIAYRSGDPRRLEAAKSEYWIFVHLCRAFKVKRAA